jgi:hypothetical protein
MTKLNDAGAISLAEKMMPVIERYEQEHGASSTVLDGLWALAFLSAYLLCSRGVNTKIARLGFIHALDHAIATAPPPDDGDDACILNLSKSRGTKH